MDQRHEDLSRAKEIETRIRARFEAPSVHARGYIKNVSRDGLFIRTDMLPATGDPVSITFVDQWDHKIEVYGTVGWTNTRLNPRVGTEPGFGVQLDRPGPEFLEFFEQLRTA